MGSKFTVIPAGSAPGGQAASRFVAWICKKGTFSRFDHESMACCARALFAAARSEVLTYVAFFCGAFHLAHRARCAKSTFTLFRQQLYGKLTLDQHIGVRLPGGSQIFSTTPTLSRFAPCATGREPSHC
jgi:hypothetical protein